MWFAVLVALCFCQVGSDGVFYERFIVDFVENQDFKILNIITSNVPDLLFHMDKKVLMPYYWTVVDQRNFSMSNNTRGTPLLHVVFQLEGFHLLDHWIKEGSNFDFWLVEDCNVPDHLGVLKHIAIDESVFFFCQTKADQITVLEAYWLKVSWAFRSTWCSYWKPSTKPSTYYWTPFLQWLTSWKDEMANKRTS